MERAYTVRELDDLMEACERRLFRYTTKSCGFSHESDREKQIARRATAVQELARTYMVAGVLAAEVEALNKEEREKHDAAVEAYRLNRAAQQ